MILCQINNYVNIVSSRLYYLDVFKNIVLTCLLLWAFYVLIMKVTGSDDPIEALLKNNSSLPATVTTYVRNEP